MECERKHLDGAKMEDVYETLLCLVTPSRRAAIVKAMIGPDYRDQVAIEAMKSWIASPLNFYYDGAEARHISGGEGLILCEPPARIAKKCYALADAMMEAREP